MELSVKNKVCVVTGAAGVLCSAMVEALCESGAKVALLGRTLSKLESLKDALASKGYNDTLAIAADVQNKEDLIKAKNNIESEWGSVDILINGAGGNHPDATTKIENFESDTDSLEGSFFGIDVDAFSSVMDLNFKGTLLPSLVFSEGMVKNGNGSIINVSSMSAERPLTKVGAYSSSKAAVDNFTRWLSVHFAKKNVRVNAIAPGFFATNQNKFLLYQEDGETLTDRGKKIINNTPMASFGDAQDLKGATVFLASDAARFVTGIILPVDGGFSAYSGV